MSETTEAWAREHFDELVRKVIDDADAVVVRRQDGNDVAVIPADELRSMEETLYLLSSRTNARRLFDAMDASERGEGERMTVEELLERVGIDLKAAN